MDGARVRERRAASWRARRRAGAVAVLVGALLAGGCATAEPQVVRLRDTSPTTQEVHADGAPAAVVAPAEAGIAEATPGALRVELEALLGHHALLATRLTRAALRGDPDLVDTADDALSGNTDDLAAVIGSVYGDAAADTFALLWSEHTRQFFVYAKGLADDDEAARDGAVAALDEYRAEFAGFVSDATGGALPADAVEDNLSVHVDHVLAQADAYAAGDREEAYALQREGYAHMFPTGQALAGGFAPALPGELPVPVDTEAQQLRSTLGMLLGEHVDLAIDALRSGVADDPDFAAASAALDANSADLAAGIEGLFGAEAGRSFADVWADHIDLFADYAVAVAADDDAGRAQVRDGLMTYHGQLGDLLAGATDGRAAAGDVGALLAEHDAQVLRAVDAYADGDYETANAVAYDGYQHMFDTAAVLAAAIEGTADEQMPAGGAATGGGGARTR